MIYLDNAATSFHRPPEVGEAVLWAMGHLGNDSRGTHGAALESGRVIYETRELLAELFGAAGPEQVAFTSNATEALNTAIKGILRPGDRAVTTVLEHNSVLRPLYEMEKMGVELAVVGTEAETGQNIRGRLDYAALEREITPGTRAVIVTHASNLTGNLTDIRRIGGMCRQAGALFIVDASQTAGIFPMDMERDCIDVLCFTGHKSLMGPQGTGGICVRKGLEIRPIKSGGSGILTFSKTHPSVMLAQGAGSGPAAGQGAGAGGQILRAGAGDPGCTDIRGFLCSGAGGHRVAQSGRRGFRPCQRLAGLGARHLHTGGRTLRASDARGPGDQGAGGGAFQLLPF